MRTVATIAALLLCAGAAGQFQPPPDRLLAVCMAMDGFPTKAEYDNDPKRYADDFCALYVHDTAKAVNQLSKSVKANRANGNPNRHYFNPQFRPDADYIQMHRGWMVDRGWTTHVIGPFRSDRWTIDYNGPWTFSHNVAGFTSCDTECVVTTRIVRLHDRNAVERPGGAWGVEIGRHRGSSWLDTWVRFETAKASDVKCAVEAALDAVDEPRGPLTQPHPIDAAVDRCLEEGTGTMQDLRSPP